VVERGVSIPDNKRLRQNGHALRVANLPLTWPLIRGPPEPVRTDLRTDYGPFPIPRRYIEQTRNAEASEGSVGPSEGAVVNSSQECKPLLVSHNESVGGDIHFR